MEKSLIQQFTSLLERRSGRKRARAKIQRKESSMLTGIVRWFNPTKGFGFFQREDGAGPDAFVHISALERANITDLAEGTRVKFDLVEDKKQNAFV